jgi:hypothetical protein
MVSTQFYTMSDVTALVTGTDITAPLPVKLIELAATHIRGDVLVNWSTASELNSDYFEVERSLDGGKFTYSGNVKAAGNSQTTQHYHFVDRIPAGTKASVAYYRLKVVDKDGASEYTKAVPVKLDQPADQPFVVFPNPFSSTVNVTVAADAPGKAYIQLTDITGRTVSSSSQTVNDGINTLEIDQAGRLKAGVYFLSVEINGKQYVEKLVKE